MMLICVEEWTMLAPYIRKKNHGNRGSEKDKNKRLSINNVWKQFIKLILYELRDKI
jgi:hypothetical protein